MDEKKPLSMTFRNMRGNFDQWSWKRRFTSIRRSITKRLRRVRDHSWSGNVLTRLNLFSIQSDNFDRNPVGDCLNQLFEVA